MLKAVSELGFATPTPIQAAVLPPALRGVDICASAVTGSGKTAAFLLPALERLLHRPRRIAATRVLVLVPTRELAAQCEEVARQLSRFTDVRLALIVGGLSLKAQEAELRTRPDIVVATPGRLIDLLRNAASVGLDELEILVLDEADRLLELGFEQELTEVVRACPASRQTLLFSATISADVASLAKLSLNAPVQVKVDPLFNVAETLQQEFVRLRPHHEHEREAVLLSLVTRTYTSKAIIFLASKKQAHRVKLLFGLFGLNAAELHGNLTQTQRLQALDDFRDGRADFLLATDLAGRGLDIRGVTTVINADLPTELKTYVHRVGRTARAGSEGRAVSIVAERDRAFLKRVLKHAADVVKTRTVPPESIEHWAERIASVEGEVRALMEEEREERAIRVAEMEANKASNMMEHREEIYSRPARSWFQTEAQRKQTREAAPRVAASAAAAAAAADADAAGNLRKRKKDHLKGGGAAGADSGDKGKVKRDKYAGKTRKQRRALERDAMFAKEAKKAAAGGDADGGAAPHSIAPNQKAIARGAKAAAKMQPLGKRSASDIAMAVHTGGVVKKPRLDDNKKEKASPAERAEAANKAAAKLAHQKKREKERSKIPKKMMSRSKPKFKKPRKR